MCPPGCAKSKKDTENTSCHILCLPCIWYRQLDRCTDILTYILTNWQKYILTKRQTFGLTWKKSDRWTDWQNHEPIESETQVRGRVMDTANYVCTIRLLRELPINKLTSRLVIIGILKSRVWPAKATKTKQKTTSKRLLTFIKLKTFKSAKTVLARR